MKPFEIPESHTLPAMHAEAMAARRELKQEVEKMNEKLDSIQGILVLIHDSMLEQMKNSPP